MITSGVWNVIDHAVLLWNREYGGVRMLESTMLEKALFEVWFFKECNG